MARKKKHPEHVNHERWLVSYADFMTLLFAFFVVMFAVSQVDSKQVGRFTESFSKAVGIDMFPESGAGLMPGAETSVAGTPGSSSPRALPLELEQIKMALTAPKANAEVPKGLKVVVRRNELVIRLSENLLFTAGDDMLREAPIATIRGLARELAPRRVDIRIEGHTDDRPIHTARFRSNWDLSTARATAVVAVLAGAGIPPARLSAAGYAEFHPVGSNTTDEGRRQNRRVDIVLTAASLEPPPAEVEEKPAASDDKHAADDTPDASDDKPAAADERPAAHDDKPGAPEAKPHGADDTHAKPEAKPHGADDTHAKPHGADKPASHGHGDAP